MTAVTPSVTITVADADGREINVVLAKDEARDIYEELGVIFDETIKPDKDVMSDPDNDPLKDLVSEFRTITFYLSNLMHSEVVPPELDNRWWEAIDQAEKLGCKLKLT